MSEINVTPLSQCLEKKLLLAGFEIPDLLAVFLTMSVLTLVFGPFGWKLFTVWLPSLALLVAIRLGKKGKPDNYMLHLIRFKFLPQQLLAFKLSEKFLPPPEYSPSLKKGVAL